MEFISSRIEEAKRLLKELNPDPTQKKLYMSLTNLVEQVALKQDILTNKIDELEELNEEMALAIRDIQEILVKNFDIEEEVSGGCNCGNCHGEHHKENEDIDSERIDAFYTLQCPFCEELFFIEKHELDMDIECPFCQKQVKAIDNIVKQ